MFLKIEKPCWISSESCMEAMPIDNKLWMNFTNCKLFWKIINRYPNATKVRNMKFLADVANKCKLDNDKKVFFWIRNDSM